MKFDFMQQPGMARMDQNINKDGKPLVSIITPFYNAGAHFEQTFNCVVNQTFPWFEWIIVDDGSTKTEDVHLVEELIRTEPRARLLHKENGGPAAARNYAVSVSETDFILPLDADDLIEPTFIDYCFWMLYKNPKAAWAYTASTGFQNIEYLWDERFDPILLKKANHLTITALIRKEWFQKVGGYTISEKFCNEDWHLWLKLVAQGGYPIQSSGEPLFWYRRTDTGVLAKVENESNLASKNQILIKKAAEDIIEPHKAIIYPNYEQTGAFKQPVLSEFQNQSKQKHDKIRVLFLFPWFTTGGADKFNLDLITGLDASMYESYIITTEKNSNEWLQLFRKAASEIFNLRNFMTPADFPEFISYIIKSREIDLLFLSNSYAGYYLLPWLRLNFPHIPFVDYVHMEEWYWRNGGYARVSGIMGSFLEQTYVCNSETEEVIVSHFHRENRTVQTVHIGVDSSYFDKKRVKAGLLYQRLKLESERPIVLFICRLHPQKRLFLMLEIAQEVAKKIPEIAFVVVGDGELNEKMHDFVEHHGLEHTVYFTGAEKEVRPFYRDAKLTLICSAKEGLALTAYESCSMGVPVISADVGGQKDLIDDKVGKLIPTFMTEEESFHVTSFSSKEIKAYTDAIVELLTDKTKWETCAKTCRDRILTKFSQQHMVDFFNRELQHIQKDYVPDSKQKLLTDALRQFGQLPGDAYTMYMMLDEAERYAGLQRYPVSGDHASVRNLEGRLSADEVVLNRHEEVLNRHEEVVNRHEKSINHQWEVQKWHEERLQRLEKRTLRNRLSAIKHKLFG